MNIELMIIFILSLFELQLVPFKEVSQVHLTLLKLSNGVVDDLSFANICNNISWTKLDMHGYKDLIKRFRDRDLDKLMSVNHTHQEKELTNVIYL
ncbi:MAG: hypothetical protein AMS17_19580 [Spirochaetes bacterium DG_61]|nr:MAG: hypothetical protein AMS17_19580 [Spirochaetes bacterium DG_61]